MVYDFCTGRGAEYPFEFLRRLDGHADARRLRRLTRRCCWTSAFDAGCMAHARRKFDELVKADASPWPPRRCSASPGCTGSRQTPRTDHRAAAGVRQQRSRPLWDELHAWLRLERQAVPDGSGIAKAIDYSLNRWEALTRFLQDGDVPIDNNHIENLMRPWAMGRKAGCSPAASSPASGRHDHEPAAVGQANGHEPWAYLKDVLTRLPTQLNSRIGELLPHRWEASDLKTKGAPAATRPHEIADEFGSTTEPGLRSAPTARRRPAPPRRSGSPGSSWWPMLHRPPEPAQDASARRLRFSESPDVRSIPKS